MQKLGSFINDVQLVFVYMDNLNYRKKLLARKNGNCNQDVPAVVSKTLPPKQREARGFDKKVLVMLTSDGDVPGYSGDWEQCILHGDIDRVESYLDDKLEQLTKHWVDLLNYPLAHRVVPPSLDFLTKLRREVVARDHSSSFWDRDFIFYFADKSESIIRRSANVTGCGSDECVRGLNITSFKERASDKDKAYVFVVTVSEGRGTLYWNQCLLYGDIEQVFSTLDSWSKQHSRITGSYLSNFRYWYGSNWKWRLDA